MKFKLNKHGIKNYTKVLQKRLKIVEEEGIKFLWNELYIKTPIRSGAARSSWNISVNAPNYSFNKLKTSNSLNIPSYKVNDTLILASGCPYIKILNDGWSKQAPANFVQISVINTKRFMNKLKIKDID